MSKKTNKVLVLGIDGLDPRLTKRYLDEGKMPNTQKFIERGSAREDLVMLGGHPTVTPPMWTTLATGTYPITHGITCFWRQDPNCGSIVSAVGAAAAPGSVTVTAIPGPGGLHVHLQPVGAEDKFCHIPLRFV